MRATSGSLVGRLRVASILTAAAALGVAATVAFGAPAAAAAPSPSPAPSPGSSPARTAPSSSTTAGRTATCAESRTGRVVNCPDMVPRSERPAAAKRTSTVNQPVTDIAQLVDTRTWTTSGGNTFPGAEAPFGMTQWSPDTMPNRNAGGGYSFGDASITGYSLTHISGPGCGAAEDVPMLPITGALPGGDPNAVTTKFTNDNEIAQAGYYSAQSNQPDTITSEFT
ncbi:MAG TPA: hypothetical protein VE442_19775, partial [Jatrophihabitans sp.]|nr:hypothetical protein [Jatrophihabitans sp.]